jgi:glycosyltransferase involved in cell wall biosynthesis
MGNLAHYTGVDLAIRALPRVRALVPAARLLVVGGGDPPYVEALRTLATALGVAEAVELRGPVPYAALPDILAECDVGLATFRPVPLGAFAFPLKVVEYMAAGLPVVGTAGSETAEILRRHPGGVAVDFDERAFADAVVELLGEPAVYRKAAAHALRAANELTWARAMAAEREAIQALA